ncbi:MAG: acetate--CoA ligase [Gaiellales bacterium]
MAETELERLRREALEDPDGFWAREAAALPWFSPWRAVLEWTPPTFTWFRGATTNVAYACLDRHVEAGRGDATALVWLREDGAERRLSYRELLHEVERVSASLRALGIGRGDRVTISMPVSVEAVCVMLGCARIGAIHSVVFAGFGAGALGQRIRLSGSKAVFVADATRRRGAPVPLKGILDEALAEGGHDIEHVIVQRREPDAAPVGAGELDWEAFLELGRGGDGTFAAVDAMDPLFILATSGTTATPKLAVHVHGGYMAGLDAMGRWVYGLGPDDVWWSTSDIGWVVGHSYIVYGPLLAGATSIAYEGSLDFPDVEQLWRIIDQERVTGLFTAPTAVRMLMQHGAEPAHRHDLGSLTRVFCAGETLNPPAWAWLQGDVLGDRVPVIDHMWQTETGVPLFANPWGLGLEEIRPGSAGLPMPGWDAAIVDPQTHDELPTGETGMMVVRRPFPSLTPTIWGDPERWARDYWSRVPDCYTSGDACRFDADGYAWFSGRADEVVKIAAHRIGTVEVETAFLHHPAVAEAGATGRPDELRGEVIAAFVVLKPGIEATAELERELRSTVRDVLGPVAVIGEVHVVSSLPKTRSGKIMRRVLRAVVTGVDVGDVSTIENEGSVEDARAAAEALRRETT